ncbi:hypothetical protein BDB01DRAFT_421981 [Pilobolus umbonatus]|nr:hypothetical protein BDB01DRAFT_421981 [Pilobolus umbonatus]
MLPLQLLDWSQRSHARPDLALLDLIYLVYPTYEVTSIFPVWMTPFKAGGVRALTLDQYGDCANMAISAYQQSKCIITSNRVNSEVPVLSEGGKAGVSIGAILVFACLSIAGIWLYRRHQRNKRHEFYRMNDM